MNIVGLHTRTAYFMEVMSNGGKRDVEIDQKTYDALREISGSATFDYSVDAGTSAPKPVEQMPEDLADKLKAVGGGSAEELFGLLTGDVEVGDHPAPPDESEIPALDEEEDPGELLDANSDWEEAEQL